MHVLPWISKILCGVRLFAPTETVNAMPLLAGTRSSLAHPFLLLVLCHHFPGGCTASFQVFDSGLPKGSPDKDVGPLFCCLWLCDYLPSLAVRGTEPEVAGGRILTLSKDHTPLFRCSIESSSLCTCAFSSAAAIPTPPEIPLFTAIQHARSF